MRWTHITELLSRAGHITLGHIAPIEGAVAADEHTLLVALVRRPDETFEELLQRLDCAIGQALNDGTHTNEIKGGRFVVPRSR